MGGGFKDDGATGPDDAGSDEAGGDAVARRTVLRFGTLAAAGAGAAALIPAATADRADADTFASLATPDVTLPTATLNEAFGGVVVQPRALERWMCSTAPIRNIVCIGDSITSGGVGGFNYASGGRGSWTERLATATGHALGPNAGYGFRGLWLGLLGAFEQEWRKAGAWTPTSPTDVFDVCPFAGGWRSNGGASATLTWTKPPQITVAGFDLYWFNMAGAGNWQYSVDGGSFVNMNQTLTPTDNKLHKFFVPTPIHNNVQIRAFNGSAACLAPIGGIGLYAADPNTSTGVIVHNLGAGAEYLSDFCRSSGGDPFAWLDAVVSNPVSLKAIPDLVIVMFSNDVALNNPTQWKNNLTKLISRVHPFADMLLMSPFEQSQRSTTMQATYRSATLAVSKTHGCAVLDLYSAWASAGTKGWAAAKRAGLMYDELHPAQLGHNDITARVWRVLRTFS